LALTAIVTGEKQPPAGYSPIMKADARVVKPIIRKPKGKISIAMLRQLVQCTDNEYLMLKVSALDLEFLI